MRIRKLWLDGYGRFSNTELSLARGLQVICGPNERGKSTVRGFICEMLYGQKRSSMQRLYDATNELRIPWDKSATYGGRMEYELDDGTVYEVQRGFDRDNESFKLFDQTNAVDVTANYEVLRNRESTFAEAQLHMSRAVFLNVATIGHASLADLGDDAALADIRERLSSLADSGESEYNTESAIKWLTQRITAIGQKSARKKPLPAARMKLDALQEEFATVRAARADVRRLEQDSVRASERLRELRAQQAACEAKIADYENRSAADRLAKAEDMTARIDALTTEMFALGDVRDFAPETLDRVRAVRPEYELAQQQVSALTGELAALESKTSQERARLEDQGTQLMPEPDPDLEESLERLDAQTRSLKERVDTLQEAVSKLESNLTGAEETLENAPDFNAIAEDPLEWLTQLSSSHSVATRNADGTREDLEKLRTRLDSIESDIAHPQSIFEQTDDFPALVREYHTARSEKSAGEKDLEHEAEVLHGTVDDLEARIPGFMLFALLAVSGVAFTAFMAYFTQNTGIYLATACLAVMALYFGSTVIVSQRRIRANLERLDEISSLESELDERERRGHEQLLTLMEAMPCDTVRELEAAYDTYKGGVLQRELIQEQIESQELRLAESEERAQGLYEKLRETLAQVGEQVGAPEEAGNAVNSAIRRYQEYRDAKRRRNEYREVLETRRAELAEAESTLSDARDEERSRALEARQFMRENGYAEEAKSDTAIAALRGYRLRMAQHRQRRGQLELYEEKRATLEQDLARQQERVEAHGAELKRHMESAGVKDLEGLVAAGEQAARYRELRKELENLEQQRALVLAGQDMVQLRERAKATGSRSGEALPSLDELRDELEGILEEIDAARKHEHQLQLAIAERTAGTRTINEVEEERDLTAQQVQELEMELQAALNAVAVLEDVTRMRHSRIAPRLAEQASAYLAEITDGAYDELYLNRDLDVTIRVPESKALHERPEQALSTGTVDQIYLSLRLAMVQCLSEESERIPMLLDDPFANYDDARLQRAMNMLNRSATNHQILFFTCREDVIAAAEACNASIIRL